MEEKVMVDTQDFVISCKEVPGLLIIASSCESCKFHKGIIEVWPGKDDKPITVKASDMTVKTFVNADNVDTGKNRQYDFSCGLPSRSRAVMFAKIVHSQEE